MKKRTINRKDTATLERLGIRYKIAQRFDATDLVLAYVDCNTENVIKLESERERLERLARTINPTKMRA